jgi:putative ABC transport system ATP-binding protein
MAENGQALIKLDGVTKVFFTDEVETHALSGIHLQINKGEYVSIAGPPGCDPPVDPRSARFAH